MNCTMSCCSEIPECLLELKTKIEGSTEKRVKKRNERARYTVSDVRENDDASVDDFTQCVGLVVVSEGENSACGSSSNNLKTHRWTQDCLLSARKHLWNEIRDGKLRFVYPASIPEC